MQSEINAALKTLYSEGIILYPTDTVWGVGCDATSVEAVNKVYHLKKREESKALICLVNSLTMLKGYVGSIPKSVHSILKNASKPTTIIYNNPKGLAHNLVSSENTIAVRIVSNGFAFSLIEQFGKPIVSTSANVSGNSTPKSFQEIEGDILKGVDYVVNLQQEKSDATPSRIIKINSDGSLSIIRD